MDDLKEVKQYYREHGSLVCGKGRTLTTITAREILEEVKDELSCSDIEIIREAILSFSKNGVDWKSRGEFVGELKWRLSKMSDKHEFAKEVLELSIRHIQKSDDLKEQGKKVYTGQSLDYSKYLLEGTLFFSERHWSSKIPVLKSGMPLEEFFFSDMDQYPDVESNRINYYDYEEDVMAQVVREVPLLPIFLMYIRASSLEIEERDGILCYDGYFDSTSTKERIFASPFQKLTAEKENYTIGDVNVLLFLMAQEGKTLYEVVDHLIQGFDLDISLRGNHVEEDEFVRRLKISQGKVQKQKVKTYA